MTLILLLVLILHIVAWIAGSGAVLFDLWTRQGGGFLKKVVWSLIALIPLFGWILYGGFYSPPGDNPIKAQGRASGWYPHWPKH